MPEPQNWSKALPEFRSAVERHGFGFNSVELIREPFEPLLKRAYIEWLRLHPSVRPQVCFNSDVV